MLYFFVLALPPENIIGYLNFEGFQVLTNSVVLFLQLTLAYNPWLQGLGSQATTPHEASGKSQAAIIYLFIYGGRYLFKLSSPNVALNIVDGILRYWGG